MKIKTFNILAILFFVIASCEQKNDDALLLITPSHLSYNIQGNQGIVFKIDASSNCLLNNLKIKSALEMQSSVVLLDSVLTTKSFRMEYNFIAPNPVKKINQKLSFILTDVDGNQTTIEKYISITPNEEFLKEFSGNEIYSSVSGKQYTYNLKNLTPVYEPFNDTSIMHLQDYITDSTNIAAISRKWRSPAGLKFVRFNDFDYTNSTLQTAKAAYDAGTKKPTVENITTNDIYITKLNSSYPDSGYVVIKMIYVIDMDSTFNDKYIFNIKK